MQGLSRVLSSKMAFILYSIHFSSVFCQTFVQGKLNATKIDLNIGGNRCNDAFALRGTRCKLSGIGVAETILHLHHYLYCVQYKNRISS